MYRERALLVFLALIVTFSVLCTADNNCNFASRRYGRFCKRNLQNERKKQIILRGLGVYRGAGSNLQYPPEEFKTSYLRDLFRDDDN